MKFRKRNEKMDELMLKVDNNNIVRLDHLCEVDPEY